MPLRLTATILPPGDGARRPLLQLGDEITLRLSVRDEANQPVAATGLRVDIRRPDGLVISRSGGEISALGAGVFETVLQVDQANLPAVTGPWTYEWVVTGPSEAHRVGSFQVQGSPVLVPGPGAPIVVTNDLNPVDSEGGGRLYAQRVSGMPRVAEALPGDLVYGVRGNQSHAIELQALQRAVAAEDNARFFQTMAQAAAAAAAGSLPDTCDVIVTEGRDARDDRGGGLYRWRATNPAHLLKFPNGGPRGGWYQLDVEVVRPEHAGGYGAERGQPHGADITTLVNAANAYAFLRGVPVAWGDRGYHINGAVQMYPGVVWTGASPGSGARGWNADARTSEDPVWRPRIVCGDSAAIYPAPAAAFADLTFWSTRALAIAGFRAGNRYVRDLRLAPRLIRYGEGLWGNQERGRITFCAFLGFHEAITGTGCGGLTTFGCIFDGNHSIRLRDVGERMLHDHHISKAWATQPAPLVEGHEDVVAVPFAPGAIIDLGDGTAGIELPQAIDWLEKFYCVVDFVELSGSTNTVRNALNPVDRVERITATRFQLLDRTGAGVWQTIPYQAGFAQIAGKFLAAPGDDQQARRITGIAASPGGQVRLTLEQPLPPCTDPQAALPNTPGFAFTVTKPSDQPISALDGVYTGTTVVSGAVYDLPIPWDPAYAAITGRFLALFPRMRMGADWTADPSIAYGFSNCDGVAIRFTQARGYKVTWDIAADNNSLERCEQETGSVPGAADVAAGMLDANFPGSIGIRLRSPLTRFDARAGHIKGAETSLEVDVSGNFQMSFVGITFGSPVRLLRGRMGFVECQFTDVEIASTLQQAYANGGRRTGAVRGLNGFNPWFRWFESMPLTRRGQLALIHSGRNVDMQTRTPDGAAISGLRMTNDGAFSAGARLALDGSYRGGAVKLDVDVDLSGYLLAIGAGETDAVEENPYPKAMRIGLAAQWQQALIEGGPRATGVVQVSCDPSAPKAVVLFQNTRLRRTSTGLEYETLQEVVVEPGASALVTVRATVGGAASNLPGGTTLTVLDPPEYLVTSAVVQAPGLAGGADGRATGTVLVSGTQGATLPAGSELLRPDNRRFTTNAAVTLGPGGTALVAVTASRGGVRDNTDTGRELAFVTPIAGINATAIVQAPGITGGANGQRPGYRLVYGPASDLGEPLEFVTARNGQVLKDPYTDALISVEVAAGDAIARYFESGRNTQGQTIPYVERLPSIVSPTKGAETGRDLIRIRVAGIMRDALDLSPEAARLRLAERMEAVPANPGDRVITDVAEVRRLIAEALEGIAMLMRVENLAWASGQSLSGWKWFGADAPTGLDIPAAMDGTFLELVTAQDTNPLAMPSTPNLSTIKPIADFGGTNGRYTLGAGKRWAFAPDALRGQGWLAVRSIDGSGVAVNQTTARTAVWHWVGA